MKIPREEFLAQVKQRDEHCNRLVEKYLNESCDDSLAEFFEIQRPLYFHRFVTIRRQPTDEFDDAWQEGVTIFLRRIKRGYPQGVAAGAVLWFAMRYGFQKVWKDRIKRMNYDIRIVKFSEISSDQEYDFAATIAAKPEPEERISGFSKDKIAAARGIHCRSLLWKDKTIDKRVTKMLKKGYSRQDISRILNVSEFVIENTIAVVRDHLIQYAENRNNPPVLTENQATVVELIVVQGLSELEIASRLNRHYGDIRSYWKSALKKIAKSPELQEQTGIRPGMYGI